jgi:hypothetical protein
LIGAHRYRVQPCIHSGFVGGGGSETCQLLVVLLCCMLVWLLCLGFRWLLLLLLPLHLALPLFAAEHGA